MARGYTLPPHPAQTERFSALRLHSATSESDLRDAASFPGRGATSKQGHLLTRTVNTPPEMSSRNRVAPRPEITVYRTRAPAAS